VSARPVRLGRQGRKVRLDKLALSGRLGLRVFLLHRDLLASKDCKVRKVSKDGKGLKVSKGRKGRSGRAARAAFLVSEIERYRWTWVV
jgi:hypothetical protein